uniref:transglycosylase domain-containing protein n=1 Tax=Allorhizocola rhizosphaerae TaxID=1872709 RepID=UPI0013C2B687
TITQQYARQAANDLEVTYARKVREAIMARKLEDTYTKEEILGFYLNTVYFGRGAHGLGAAAEAYFGMPADDVYTKMTVAQAALLGAVLKQPEGANGFDPAKNPENAKNRWNYVLNNMVDNGWLKAEERATLKYPEPADPANPVKGAELQPFVENGGGAWGYTDRGTGHVIDRVEAELEEKGVIAFLRDQLGIQSWRDGGLRIVTTIDPVIQGALEKQLNRNLDGSTMSKQRDNIVGAGVVIDPKTGRVLAYYGGTNNGTGIDYAGEAPHPAASSFKIYTLAAALDAGISVKSRWDPTELKKSKGDPIDLGNSTRDNPDDCGTNCSLEEMTVASYNVPFYKISSAPKLGIGHQKVVQMASAAGVKTMWGIDGKAYDTSKGGPFDPYVGIGKFPITVLDHAAGTATIANGGVYNKPHFVLKVQRKNKKTGQWDQIPIGDERLTPQQVIRREVADEVTHLLKKIPTGQYQLAGGRESAGKTGTWENGLYPKMNAHVWFTGYTAQLSTTIWLGSKDENKTPIKMPGSSDVMKGENMQSNYPKLLWKNFMNEAHSAKGYKNERLAPNHRYGRIGDDNRGDGKRADPEPGDCNPIFPWFCPPGRRDR